MATFALVTLFVMFFSNGQDFRDKDLYVSN